MSNRALSISVFVIPVTLAIMLITSLQRWRSAELKMIAADAVAGTVVTDATALVELRRTRMRVNWAKRPTAVALDLVREALDRSGVPADRLVTLTEHADSAIPTRFGADGPELRRQTIRLTLERITLNELGRFLQAWRSHPESSAWVVSALELRGVNGVERQAAVAEDVGYMVSISLSATYATDGSSS